MKTLSRKTRDSYVACPHVVRYVPGGEVWVYQIETQVHGTRYYAAAFIGRAQKPAWHYQFRTAERREAYLADWAAQQKGVVDFHAARAAKAAAVKAAGHGLQPGAILDRVWGYDQTNVDFFRVTRVTRATVTVVPIAATLEETGFMCGLTSPCQDTVTGKEFTCRVTYTAEGARVCHRGDWLSVWTGRPVACSWYA